MLLQPHRRHGTGTLITNYDNITKKRQPTRGPAPPYDTVGQASEETQGKDLNIHTRNVVLRQR